MLYRVRLVRSENDNNKYTYLINGKVKPVLELKEDKTYMFDIYTPGYPFYFTNSNQGGKGDNDQDALSKPIEQGTINFIVKEHDPDNCYYQCSVVANMGNIINKKRSVSPRNGYEADHDMYHYQNSNAGWEPVKTSGTWKK